jgi:hypothetical protein
MLIPLTVSVVLFPARSTAVPLTDWSSASDATVTGVGPHEATPEGASSHENETTTSALFQPDAFAAGNREPVIVGAVLSTLTSIGSLEALLPALSDTLPETLCPSAGVLALTTTADGQASSNSEVASKQANVTVTVWFVQVPDVYVPASASIVGSVASRLIVTEALAVPPALVAEHEYVVSF